MQTQALPYVALLGTLWGVNLVVSRFGIGQFDPVLFAGLRVGLAASGYAAIYALSRERQWPRNGRLWQRAIILGIIGTAVPMVSIISSLQYQSSGVTAVFITTAPAYIVLAAHFFLPDEPLNWPKGAGVLLALIGALVIVISGENGLPDVSETNPLGYGLIALALTGETFGAIFIRRYMRDFDAVEVTSVRLLTAAAVLMPLALLWRGFDLSRVDGQGVLSLLFAALAGVFMAQFLAFYITRRFGATIFSTTSYVIPVAAAIAGVFLLGETITAVMIIGMALIATGITLINRYT